MAPSDADFEDCFSKDYVQHVDGKVFNDLDFVQHMKAQKRVMRSLHIEFKQMVAEKDQVYTLHIAKGIKKDGSTIEAQVNAYFQLKNDKIVFCDELTRLNKGSKEDQDLGSRK